MSQKLREPKALAKRKSINIMRNQITITEKSKRINKHFEDMHV